MDPAVGLVQAYLRVNGFFTVTEYPVVKRTRQGARVLTDLDVLAIRFPSGGRWVQQQSGEWGTFETDPALPESSEHLVMILGEVKEGKAVFNRNAFDPDVLEAVLRRYGCCHDGIRETALALSRKGCLTTPMEHGSNCEIHTMLFGGTDSPKHSKTHYVSLRHVSEFLASTVWRNADLFVAAQPKDDVLDLISVLVKTGARIGLSDGLTVRPKPSARTLRATATTRPRPDTGRKSTRS